jgi:hypothetical protein
MTAANEKKRLTEAASSAEIGRAVCASLTAMEGALVPLMEDCERRNVPLEQAGVALLAIGIGHLKAAGISRGFLISRRSYSHSTVVHTSDGKQATGKRPAHARSSWQPRHGVSIVQRRIGAAA